MRACHVTIFQNRNPNFSSNPSCHHAGSHHRSATANLAVKPPTTTVSSPSSLQRKHANGTVTATTIFSPRTCNIQVWQHHLRTDLRRNCAIDGPRTALHQAREPATPSPLSIFISANITVKPVADADHEQPSSSQNQCRTLSQHSSPFTNLHQIHAPQIGKRELHCNRSTVTASHLCTATTVTSESPQRVARANKIHASAPAFLHRSTASNCNIGSRPPQISATCNANSNVGSHCRRSAPPHLPPSSLDLFAPAASMAAT
ncbi:hypothetical protein DEO72_LG10g1501 [Vigna unguiculata]|uniref:Uncharacterized protein n=1 Tax=Vigna unguiculata TaxID=3917 RepID=A0A4D6N8V7_VIGUN|nr:hypothetical protein DEO72_LG10g1501 [Vigna unguiculata]